MQVDGLGPALSISLLGISVDIMKALFIGNVFTSSTAEASPGVHVSVNNWFKSFVTEISRICEVQMLGYKHDHYYPKGGLVPGREVELNKSFDQSLAKYLNVPVLRKHSALYSLKIEFRAHVKKYGKPDIVFFPGEIEYVSEFCRWISVEFGVQVVKLVLDWISASGDWGEFIKRYGYCAGYVFLSKWCYDNCPLGPKYLFEGCLPSESYGPPGMEAFNSRQLLYTGKFYPAGGIEILIDVMSEISLEELGITFAITCPHEIDRSKLNLPDSVRFLGNLSDEDLQRVMRNATAFINPYLPDHKANLSTFPSKLLTYLPYCKPVISTITPGISEAVHPLLTNFDIYNKDSVRIAIKNVFEMDFETYLESAAIKNEYITTSFSNKERCGALVDWLMATVLG